MGFAFRSAVSCVHVCSVTAPRPLTTYPHPPTATYYHLLPLTATYLHLLTLTNTHYHLPQADDVTANSTVSEAVAVTPVVHVCGNGIRSSAEACDDNNTIGADGCDSLCQLESGFACTSSTQGGGGGGDGSGVGGLDTCAAVCGDGRRVSWGGEGCDDNNTAPGDGCSASCAIEPGFACTGQP